MMETLLSFDAGLFLIINSHHSHFFDSFFYIVTQLGYIWVTAPLVLLIVVKKTAKKYLRNTLIFIALAAAVNLGTVTAIKVTVNRPRPVVYFQNEYAVHVVGPVVEKYSFPSGHTAAAFTGAAILFYLFGGWFWVGYAVAALVGYSRVYVGAHFPLDVFGGMFLALLITWITFYTGSRMKAIPHKGKFGQS